MLLRDTQHTRTADQRFVFLQNLNSPIGMALVGDPFYVADTDAVLRFPYHTGDTEMLAQPVKFTDLPAGPINHLVTSVAGERNTREPPTTA